MPDREFPVPILRTRLHRPPVAPDVVLRNALLERLERGRRLPLTLVSAPAGYGKSTLLSRWLETSDAPGAWLSIEETDADPRCFLSYVIAAVRSVYPDACEETLELLHAAELPAAQILAGQLINDLDDMGEELLLVLDDYHRLPESDVHDVLNSLLEFPPRGLHLVIAGRRDPPLRHRRLRAQRLMNEIRVRDLQLTEAESAAFVRQVLGRAIEYESVRRVHQGTEGWPVGLRLAALALSHRPDSRRVTDGFVGDLQQLQEYLLEEVLSHQPEGMRSCLEMCSTLDRFCAPLCDAVFGRGAGGHDAGLSGTAFIDGLKASGLLTVALDERGVWHRFHHLFQDLLRQELEARNTFEEVAAMRRRAAGWLEEADLVEEALGHLLAIGDAEAAGRVVLRRRQSLVDQEQWPRIERWLGVLPRSVIEADADLLILRSRTHDKLGQYMEMREALDRAEALLSQREEPDSGDRRRLGELHAHRCALHYHGARGDAALKDADEALRLLPQGAASERAMVMMVRGLSMQMTGDAARARRAVHEALRRDALGAPTYHGRLLQALGFLQWVDADLHELLSTARTMKEVGQRHGLPETTVYAHYFEGAALYHLDQLNASADALRPVVEDPGGPSFFIHLMSVQASALIHASAGRHAEARRLADALSEHHLRAGTTSYRTHVEALKAELALRNGRSASALSWAWDSAGGPSMAGYHFSVPELTAARALLHDGLPRALETAGGLLARCLEFFVDTHNVRFHVETLALQALLCEGKGDRPGADAKLHAAIRLALPGGWTRLFVDQGPRLAPILARLKPGGEASAHAQRILEALGSVAAPATDPSPPRTTREGGRAPLDPLTGREAEVLGLLAQRLTNKEIAAQLFIAPGTVRRHAENIYSKLDVHGRREAVARAKDLGLLHS